MKIHAENISKRFHRDWIISPQTLTIESTECVALIGTNGSGKSTLLQLLASLLVPTTGSLSYITSDNKILSLSSAVLQCTYVAPYQELIEELTVDEFLSWHFSLRVGDFTNSKDFLSYAGIPGSIHKEIRFFSSGMKQRLKLGIAFRTAAAITFLDEPTSYLDAQGIKWYEEEIKKLFHQRTIVLASNIEKEYQLADRTLLL
ncbi:MAG: ATP-binding cassette domain-containing protein [Cytophagaceae bacterium]|jgi:ABC-type multidrug transport system ATPase subunit|nr:ATP-binding cassette domain-containing protein [Cytophagaceae bacterium]